VVLAHGRLKLTRTASFFRALWLAWTTRPPGLRGLLHQFAYLIEAGLVADCMRRRGIRHLHNHLADSSCTVAMLAAELGGFTFSFTLHGPYVFFEPQRWRLDAKLARAAFVVCVSHFCRSQAMIWTLPERWDRLHIVHCGIDPAAYTPVRHTDKGSRLIFVGRLAAVKGVGVLLDALATLSAKYPNLRLILVGDGPDRAWLEARATVLGIAERVTITGHIAPQDVAKRLAESDVFVMASFAEGVPVVLMEAMASELPVVATRIAGIPELVEDGVNGFLVAPGDAAGLAARIDPLLENPELRTRLGRAGRAKVKAEFETGQETAKLKSLFERVLTSSS
jgi:glycosyltransferase involved in cell wall biosynthesis